MVALASSVALGVFVLIKDTHTHTHRVNESDKRETLSVNLCPALKTNES
jgi:hypothetical protein